MMYESYTIYYNGLPGELQGFATWGPYATIEGARAEARRLADEGRTVYIQRESDNARSAPTTDGEWTPWP